MSRGIANFLDRASRVVDPALLTPTDPIRRIKETEERSVHKPGLEIITEPPDDQPKTLQHIEVEDSKVDLEVAPHVIVTQPEPMESKNTDLKEARVKDANSNESVLDKIRSTLDHAAEILRESLELSGGVVFLDPANSLPLETTSGHDDKISRHLSNGSARYSSHDYRPARLQAVSMASDATWDREKRVDGKALQVLIASYPYVYTWSLRF